MEDRIVASLVTMVCVLGFCVVLLCFGNDVQTAVIWSGVAGGVAGQVSARLLAGASSSSKQPGKKHR